jgi:hypothetical protein
MVDTRTGRGALASALVLGTRELEIDPAAWLDASGAAESIDDSAAASAAEGAAAEEEATLGRAATAESSPAGAPPEAQVQGAADEAQAAGHADHAAATPTAADTFQFGARFRDELLRDVARAGPEFLALAQCESCLARDVARSVDDRLGSTSRIG